MGKIARFEMPDGRIGRFEVPDDATPEQAQAMIAESLQPKASVEVSGAPELPVWTSSQGKVKMPGTFSSSEVEGGGAAFGRPRVADRTNVLPEPRPTESLLAGATKSIIDPFVGAAQIVTGGNLGTSELAQKLREQADVYSEENPIAYGTGRVLGAVAPASAITKPVGMIPSFAQATALKGGAQTAARIGEGAVGGAIGGALTPEETGKKGSELYNQQLKEMSIGAGAGGVLSGIGQGLKYLNEKSGLNIGRKLAETPTQEFLENKANALFKSAKESGVEINAKDFATTMAGITKDLRNEGYDPRLYPKLAVAVEELKNVGIPKDFNELKTLRKFIQNAQKSTDEQEKMLATSLKADFDNYIANLPETSVIGGNKKGLADWKEARDTYNKLSKAEVFENMLEKAKLDKQKYTQSGEENSLFFQLRKLAESPKQLRLFTAEEQEAIKKAVEGNNLQNAMRLYGKFVPNGPMSGIFAGGAMVANPWIGVPFEAGSLASRMGATKIRKNDVNRLAAMVRSGELPQYLENPNLSDEQKKIARFLMTQGVQRFTGGE